LPGFLRGFYPEWMKANDKICSNFFSTLVTDSNFGRDQLFSTKDTS